MKTEIVITANLPGWKPIYMRNLPHIPQAGDHIDLCDEDFPEHQTQLQRGRMSLKDATVNYVFHLISKRKQTILIEIHFVIVKRVYI